MEKVLNISRYPSALHLISWVWWMVPFECDSGADSGRSPSPGGLGRWGSAVAWVGGQCPCLCNWCVSRSASRTRIRSHISRALQLFRKGFRAWAVIRGSSDEMGYSQGYFVPFSLPVSVCQQPQFSLNSLLGPDSQQIKMCSLQMQHWGVCLPKVLWNEWFGVEECSLDNFVHTPVGWVCNRNLYVDGAGKQLIQGSISSSDLSCPDPAPFWEPNVPLESEISEVQQPHGKVSATSRVELPNDLLLCTPGVCLLFHLKEIFSLWDSQPEPFPSEPKFRNV